LTNEDKRSSSRRRDRGDQTLLPETSFGLNSQQRGEEAKPMPQIAMLETLSVLALELRKEQAQGEVEV
jgi:hypothetical protein